MITKSHHSNITRSVAETCYYKQLKNFKNEQVIFQYYLQFSCTFLGALYIDVIEKTYKLLEKTLKIRLFIICNKSNGP